MKPVRHIIFPMLTAAWLLSGCTAVEYGAAEDMPDSISVSFKFDWKEQEASENMCVLMSRVINTIHYGWLVEPDGTVMGTLLELMPDTPATPENPQTPADPGTSETPDGGMSGTGRETDVEYDVEQPAQQTDMTVMNGEYYVMAFNNDNSTFTASGMKEFLSDPAASMKGIRISAIRMTDEEISAGYGGERTDFNPLYGFIRSVDPVFIDVQQARISPEQQTEITFAPVSLTQQLTFRINMETDSGVSLEDITAEISGLAGSVEAMTGQIDNNTTFRTIFKMSEISADGNKSVYEGTIHTFGLFPSKDLSFITGPGILQLTVRATDGSDTKVFHAGINIRETINSAGLLEELDNGKFRITSHAAALHIPNTLRIDRDQIAPGEDQGVEIWIDSDEMIEAEI